ncbi:MAG: hypothetical protein QNL77_03155, partial [Akkermansiaceae bacterium]
CGNRGAIHGPHLLYPVDNSDSLPLSLEKVEALSIALDFSASDRDNDDQPLFFNHETSYSFSSL